MKTTAKHLFSAAVSISALMACTDSNLTELESQMTEPETGMTVNSAVLTDADGQQLTSVSPDFGTYYLDIKTDGVWYIETPDNMEFTPTRMYGQGSARVPVMIGNNWAESRELTYQVHFEKGEETRADGDNTQKVTQESGTDLASFKKIVSSNIFVGYGYNPTKSAISELCTGIAIFKMETLNEDEKIVKSFLSPQAKEEYYYSHSDSVMDKILAVQGNPGGNFGVVKLGLSADVNVNRINHTGKTVVHKSLTRSVYGRELAWAEIWRDNANYTDGFIYYKNRFINQFKNAGNDSVKQKAAADEFFRIVGTHFISKALLGCELNYRMSVDSSKVITSTSVKAALDFKWQQQIKDTASVDSLTKAKIMELMNDSSKRKNFIFSGKVQYTDSAFNASTSTQAKVKARGGDVELVNILTTGGSLYCEDLAKWMLGTDPAKATMVGIVVQPIYDIFIDKEGNNNVESDETKAHDFLKKYIDRSFCVDPQQYGHTLDVDLK